MFVYLLKKHFVETGFKYEGTFATSGRTKCEQSGVHIERQESCDITVNKIVYFANLQLCRTSFSIMEQIRWLVAWILLFYSLNLESVYCF